MPMAIKTQKSTKKSWSVLTTNKIFNPAYLKKVLNNSIAGYVIRGFISEKQALEIARKFDHHPKLEVNIGSNGVHKYWLKLAGPKQNADRNYFKYFDYTEKNQKVIDSLFAGGMIVHRKVAEIADEFYQKKYGTHFRPFRYHGKDANFGNLQKWTGSENGLTSLMHCDYDNYHLEKNRTLEFYNIKTIGSFVFCYRNGTQGGFTRIYNYQPTWKEHEDSQYYYDYQDKLKKMIQKPSYYINTRKAQHTDVVLKAGDILIFCAANFHEVGATTKGRSRVAGHMFFGELPSGDLIYWF